ncbi:TetR-like C-terminal domain-containing protein [Nocardioides sp. YIM 152588]|uniref:TetR-like C-terminal domain-containing protein n=1 Tax=Nocardioides sp. YIM 152588 TaxID=3158259 RepID=UPI0032E472E5
MTSPVSTPAAAGRRPGRPRQEDIEERAIAATLALVDAGEAITLNRVVATSGVSRAAVYRRWPSLTALLAAALDHGRTTPDVAPGGSLRERLLGTYLTGASEALRDYPDGRFRRRLALGLADRELQTTYWESHAHRRREPVTALLRDGVARGELRADLDVEAAIDLINGVFYYQVVVRGDSVTDPSVQARCAAALDVVWRGIVAPGTA